MQQWAFAALYRQGVPWYDLVARAAFGADWSAWRSAAGSMAVGSPLLDLGCGNGALGSELYRGGVMVVSLDMSCAMLAAARRRDPPLALVQADAARLPFARHTFATVIATYPAPFILHPAVAQEIHQVLQPSGRVIVLVGGAIEWWRWWQAPRRLLLRVIYGPHARASPAEPLLCGAPYEGHWVQVIGPQGRGWVWVGKAV